MKCVDQSFQTEKSTCKDSKRAFCVILFPSKFCYCNSAVTQTVVNILQLRDIIIK